MLILVNDYNAYTYSNPSQLLINHVILMLHLVENEPVCSCSLTQTFIKTNDSCCTCIIIPNVLTYHFADRLMQKTFLPHHNQNNRSNPRHVVHCWKTENISFFMMYYVVVGLVKCQLQQGLTIQLYMTLFMFDFCAVKFQMHEFHSSHTCELLLRVCPKKKYANLEFSLHSFEMTPSFMFVLVLFVFYA